MIFVDTNVLMYAVGRAHPLRTEAQAFFEITVPSRLNRSQKETVRLTPSPSPLPLSLPI